MIPLLHRRKSFTAGPVASVDSITTTSMAGLTGGLGSLAPGYFHMVRIDDNRLLIQYLKASPANEYAMVVADRAGGTTYTFGTPVTLTYRGAGCSAGAAITISNNTGFDVHTISGTAITASVGTGTLTNRETNAGGAAMMLMDGETAKFFVVQQKRSDTDIWGQIIDITTPSSPSVGTEVNLEGAGTTFDYVLAMSRVDGNRFVVASTGTSNALRLFIVDADPGHSHTTGAVYTVSGSNTSGMTYAVQALSPTRGVCYYRSGTIGANGNLQLFAIDSGTKVITAVDTDTPPVGTNVATRADIRAGANPDEFIFTRSSGGTVETSIYSIAGDVLTELDTLSKGSISTYTWRTGPSGCAQGNNIAYLSGKSTTGLHFVQCYGG